MMLSPTEYTDIARRWGFTAGQVREILRPADPTVCGWYDGSCAELPLTPGGFCGGHDAQVMHRPSAQDIRPAVTL